VRQALEHASELTAFAGRRVEKEDVQEFHVAGGPLDRPSAGQSMRRIIGQVDPAGLTELFDLKKPLPPHKEANVGAMAARRDSGGGDSLHELQLLKDALPEHWVRFEETQTFFSVLPASAPPPAPPPAPAHAPAPVPAPAIAPAAAPALVNRPPRFQHGLDELHGIVLDFGHVTPRVDQMAASNDETAAAAAARGGESRAVDEGARKGSEKEEEAQEAKNEFDTCMEDKDRNSGDLKNCMLLKVSQELDKMQDKSWTPAQEERRVYSHFPSSLLLYPFSCSFCSCSYFSSSPSFLSYPPLSSSSLCFSLFLILNHSRLASFSQQEDRGGASLLCVCQSPRGEGEGEE